MNHRRFLILLAAVAVFSGACATVQPQFEDDWTISDFFRAGQTAYTDQGNADLAIGYYEEIFIRFPDSPRLVEADYEIAFVLYKSGKKMEAAERFRKVLTYYPDPSLASWPETLAQKLLNQMKQ